jgi:hypothetical protein
VVSCTRAVRFDDFGFHFGGYLSCYDFIASCIIIYGGGVYLMSSGITVLWQYVVFSIDNQFIYQVIGVICSIDSVCQELPHYWRETRQTASLLAGDTSDSLTIGGRHVRQPHYWRETRQTALTYWEAILTNCIALTTIELANFLTKPMKPCNNHRELFGILLEIFIKNIVHKHLHSI